MNEKRLGLSDLGLDLGLDFGLGLGIGSGLGLGIGLALGIGIGLARHLYLFDPPLDLFQEGQRHTVESPQSAKQ